MKHRHLTRTGAALACVLASTFASTTFAAVATDGSGGIGTGGGGADPRTDASEPSSGQFPVRGKHEYGDGLGAGRDHQGQDLLAKCGKRVVAALPGRVQLVDYHGSAGNYVVVDGKGKRMDTAYMHLQRRASVREGERVSAGQTLGRVGSTGNASTCHLHFEIWSAPGYYEGGNPVDPYPHLKRWDHAH